MTQKEFNEIILEKEKERKFDEHVEPIKMDLYVTVDENYHYIHMRTFKEKMKLFFQRNFLNRPIEWVINKKELKTKVIGKENIRGIENAIVICNHVAPFDCLAARYALKPKRVHTISAAFNNRSDMLGTLMRSGDMIPLNPTLHGTKNFNDAIRHILLERKEFVMIYPEASMWPKYRKVRPYKDGAFQMAQKYNVPILPLFITFRDGKKVDEDGLKEQFFTVNILKPIYPNSELSKKDNIEYLKTKAFEECKNAYEDTYGIKLKYED